MKKPAGILALRTTMASWENSLEANVENIERSTEHNTANIVVRKPAENVMVTETVMKLAVAVAIAAEKW